MTKDVQDAIRILGNAISIVCLRRDIGREERMINVITLRNAIRHLAYPDRDVYPKTRRATKGAPIVRK